MAETKTLEDLGALKGSEPAPAPVHTQKLDAHGRAYATGKRKNAVARVWIKPGSGRFLVNRRPFEDFFPRETLRMIILQPLQVTNTAGQFDVIIRVGGGGPTGQAGAVRHGLSRALTRFDENLRSPLKKAGLLTRDPRMKERKKYGQPGARQKFQYSKR